MREEKTLWCRDWREMI